jgi:anti-sigma B factor antagonist
METKATPQVEEALNPLFASKSKEIVIDCSKLEYISSSGFRVFLSIALDSQTSGKHVIIKGVNSFLHEMFKITGFLDLFDFQ